MTVSMDGLRRQLLFNYNSLAEKLNSRITDASWDPQIIIGEGGWKEMDENTHFEQFNPEEVEED